ncbi:tRNA epoxyqueuosine(34) reductase QueG [Saccharicrinis sp. FJH54]|uniref:tRNA epoxyqueuosine(34) reductase QueG n=1 Tax=Saccharicrinis sp. FJH54 TaxID=3344665 RepID=UPI0035D5245B
MNDTGPDKLTKIIRSMILDQGFTDVTFARVRSLDEYIPSFNKWLENDYHAGMSFMENYKDKRIDPAELVPGARTVVVAIMNYFPEHKQPEDIPQVAKYAYGRDYHKVLKKKLKRVLEHLKTEYAVSGRVFVDSAPVMEKPLGEISGMGWIGKNGCLIHPRYGSFFVMGELIIDAEVEYGKPAVMACGSCMKCIEACPTNAIVSPGVINSEKCLSYLTIEKKDKEVWEVDSLHNRIFGCDICQDVCPWNKKSSPSKEPDFNPRNDLMNLTVDRWSAFNESEFRDCFAGTPLMRAGYVGMQRSLSMLKSKSPK